MFERITEGTWENICFLMILSENSKGLNIIIKIKKTPQTLKSERDAHQVLKSLLSASCLLD